MVALGNHNAVTFVFLDDVIPMPALTIKNIPVDLYEELKLTAQQHHRSINSEVIMCLKQKLFPNKSSTQDTLSSIQALRSQIKSDLITPQEIEQAINEGRS